MMYLRLLIAYLFISPCAVLAQGEFYLEYNYDRDIIETYDGTYLFLGEIDVGGWGGVLTKVQANGEELWEIKLSDAPDQAPIIPINILSDTLGNIYVGGTTYQYDGYGSIFIIKLNACGELEWLRIGDYLDFWDSFEGLQFAANGDLLIATDQTHGVVDQNTGDGFPPGKLRLTRMTTEGDTIWYDKFYPEGCGDCLLKGLKASADNGAFMALDDHYVYDGSPNYIRPAITKFDEDGEVEWVNMFGLELGIIGALPSVVELKSGNICVVFMKRKIGDPFYFKPYYYKLSPQGEVLEHFRLDVDSLLSYDANRLVIINDSTMALTVSPSTPTASEIMNYHFQLLTIDTAGQVLDSYIDSADFLLCSGVKITHNEDVLVALTKVYSTDKDVNVKRINPQTMTLVDFPPSVVDYDYLCPYPVESYDFNLKTSSLSIENGIAVQSWPNPASEGFYIRWRGAAMSGEVDYHLYDLNGVQIESRSFSAKSPEQWVNTSHLAAGMYVWHLTYEGMVISKNKIVIE